MELELVMESLAMELLVMESDDLLFEEDPGMFMNSEWLLLITPCSKRSD